MPFEEFLSGKPAGLDRGEIAARIERLASWPCEGKGFEAISGLFSPDVVCEFVGDRARISYAGRHVGIEALANINRSIAVEFEQLDYSLFDILIDGGRAAVRRSVEWRHRGTGRLGRVELADFVRFEEGLIVELIEFRDSITILSMQGERSWP